MTKQNEQEYLVSFYYSESGNTLIRARSKKEAELKVKEKLEWSGLDELKYDCEDRGYEILNNRGIN